MDFVKTSIKDLLEINHKFVSVLHLNGIDYLDCLDNRLTEVCERYRLNTDRIVFQLKAVMRSPALKVLDFHVLTTEDIILYLKHTHITYSRVMLPIIQYHIRQIQEDTVLEYPNLALLNQNFGVFRKDMLKHIHFEENTVFPYMFQLLMAQRIFKHSIYFVMKENSLSNLFQRHSEDDDEMLQLAMLTNDYEVNSYDSIAYRVLMLELQDFSEDLKEHSRIEEKVLLPKMLDIENQLRTKIVELSHLN